MYGLIVSQFGDLQTKLESGETVAEYLRDYLGYRYDFLWVASLAVIGFALLFVLVFAFSMKCFNFQKR